MKTLFALTALIGGLTASTTALSIANDSQHRVEKIQTSAPVAPSDAAALLAEVDDVMTRVKAGELGSMNEQEMAVLEAARKHISGLLGGHAKVSDLEPEQRIELYNTQELMVAVIRRRHFEQDICKRLVPIGTRIPTYECLSSERRDLRVRNTRETTQLLQRLGTLQAR